MRKDGIQTRKRKPKKSGSGGVDMGGGKKDDMGDGKLNFYNEIRNTYRIYIFF